MKFGLNQMVDEVNDIIEKLSSCFDLISTAQPKLASNGTWSPSFVTS